MKDLRLTSSHARSPGRLCLLIAHCSLLIVLLLVSCGNGNEAKGVTEYTVSFETKGGSGIDDQVVAEGGLVSQPSNPARENYSFGGWYKESGLSTLWNFNSDAVTSDITLYAKWNPVPTGNFVVTFNSNGGTIIQDQVIAAGGLVSRPANITKPNSFFGGWYKESNFASLWNFASDTVTGAVTLYAKWTDEEPVAVTITINADNGSAVTSIQLPYNAVLPPAYFGTGANVPAKPGYRFTGWKNGPATITAATRFTQNADLIAQWARQITVKFELGEINGVPVEGDPPADVVIDNDTALGSRYPPNPSLGAEMAEDYEFAGWFNNEQQYDGTDRINASGSEFTLTARWEEINKTITTQNPAIHPGNHFMEAYPDAAMTVTVNETFTISGLFSNVEPGAGVLSAKWFRAATETGAGTEVGAQTAEVENPHEISLKYTGAETAVGTFWYWVEVTNYNGNATEGYQTSTSKTQNRLKVIVTGS